MDGRATFTIVVSRATMNCAAQTSASTNQGDVTPREAVVEVLG